MGTSSNDGAEGWLRLQDPAELRITAITRAEVRYGIARLPAGRRRSDDERAADAFFTSQRSRVLAFDAIVATRDPGGFDLTGVEVIDPFA